MNLTLLTIFIAFAYAKPGIEENLLHNYEYDADSLASTPQNNDLGNVLDRMSVSCGGHYAKSCKECHKGNGAGWCNGDCIWVDNNCKDKPKTTTTTKTTTKRKTTTTTTKTAKTTTKQKATTT